MYNLFINKFYKCIINCQINVLGSKLILMMELRYLFGWMLQQKLKMYNNEENNNILYINYNRFALLYWKIILLQRPDDHRRKWNREEYERIALQRLQDEIAEEELGIPKQPAVKRELLKQRDYKVDLESKLGKSVVINKNTPSSQTGGYN